jgi:glycosyltransferase involved in cell wall biosynthesis
MKKIVIALPVYNEESVLAKSVGMVVTTLRGLELLGETLIVIADNASTDNTGTIGKQLAHDISQVQYLWVPQQGKGGAIRAAWNAYPADIACFMDIDLSTDLEALPRLLAAFANDADVVFGSRFAPGAVVRRSLIRKLLSYGYRWLVAQLFGFRGDPNCGFKAVGARVVQELLPTVKNNDFFFDTELLLLARAAGFRLVELPVRWEEHRFVGRHSKVKLVQTALRDLREIWRLKQRLKNHP